MIKKDKLDNSQNDNYQNDSIDYPYPIYSNAGARQPGMGYYITGVGYLFYPPQWRRLHIATSTQKYINVLPKPPS